MISRKPEYSKELKQQRLTLGLVCWCSTFRKILSFPTQNKCKHHVQEMWEVPLAARLLQPDGSPASYAGLCIPGVSICHQIKAFPCKATANGRGRPRYTEWSAPIGSGTDNKGRPSILSAYSSDRTGGAIFLRAISQYLQRPHLRDESREGK